jgi:ribosomal protein S18 acetylase RimI-like enzyme
LPDFGFFVSTTTTPLAAFEPQAFGSSYNEENKKTKSEWQNKLAESGNSQGKSFFYAALKEGFFVAIGGAYQDNNRQWNIIAVYTKKEFRGQGLGQKILESIINELRVRKIKKAYLCVNTLQTEAQALYKKNGFIIKQIIKDQLLGDKKYYDEIEMFINL